MEKTDTATPAAEATPATTAEADKLFDAAVESIGKGETPAVGTGEDPLAEKTAADGEAGKTGTTEPARGADGKFLPKTDAAATAAAAAADPFKDLPEEQRKAVETAIAKVREESQAKITEAQQRAERHASQVGGYERKLREASAALEAAKKTGDSGAVAAAKKASDEASAKLAALKKDYPHIGDAVEAAIADATSAIRKELEAKFQQEVAGIRKAVDPLVRTHVTTQEHAEVAAIEAAHKGWQQTVETEEFKTWWGKQSKGVQALAQGGAEDEIALFDLFRKAHPLPATNSAEVAAKAAADKLAAQREQQRRDAAGPSGKPTTSPGLKTDPGSAEAMFDAAAKQVARELRVQ